MTCEAPDAAAGWVPEWIFCPREFIREVIFAFIANGVDSLIETTVFVIQTVQSETIGAFVVAGEAVWDAGSDVAVVYLDLQRFLNSVIYNLAAGSGFAGPIASAVTFAVVMAVVFALLRFGTWALKWIK